MTYTVYQACWCIGQVTLLAVLAFVTMAIWQRRRPAESARVASAAIGAILAVTLLALVPSPDWTPWHSARDASQITPGMDGPQNPDRTSAADSSPAISRFSVVALYSALTKSVRATVRYSALPGVAWWVAVFASISISIGIFRLAWALHYLWQLYRDSTPLESDHAVEIVHQLADSLGVNQRYELRQSSRLVSPAVIGWRRPAILIPAAWPTWSVDQLRAALAHELAHVHRGDSFTRLVASCATTLHFYHPLVHWLAAKLTLSQELAADRLAALAMGGESRYLHAISQLAIWLDDQPRLRPEPLLLPAFSSNLIRRIKMLRATDCSSAKERPRRRTAAFVALLALVALITTALRGSAENSTPGDSTSTASLPSTTLAKSFSRPPLDFSIIGDNGAGAFVIRLGEILKQPGLRALIETQMLPDKETLKQNWAAEFGPDVAPPDLDLDAIDYVAGIGNLIIRPAKPSDPPTSVGANTVMMTGAAEAIVHFNRPVRWKEWFHDHFPGTAEKTDGDVNYLELPVIKALGQVPLFVMARDPQTIVLINGPDRLASAADPMPRPANSAMAARWTELDGGLLTLIATDHDIHMSEPSPSTPEAILGSKLCVASRLVGLAIDADPHTREACFRLQLTCDDIASAEQLQSTFKSILELANTAMANASHPATTGTPPANAAGKTAQELDTERIWAEILATCQVKVWQKTDSAAGILVDSTATLPDYAATPITAARESTVSPK